MALNWSVLNIGTEGFGSYDLAQHTATAIGRTVYVFGGLSRKYLTVNSDIYKLDLSRYEWTKIEPHATQITPPCVYGHTADLINDRILFFGGSSYLFSKPKPYFYIFDILLNEWIYPKTIGRPPRLPYGHTSNHIPSQDQIVFFGGADLNGTFTNETRVLVLKDLSWKPLIAKGKIPAPRSQHCSCVKDERIFFFGGRNADTFFAFLYILSFHQIPPAWETPKITGNAPPGLRLSTMNMINGKVFVFGGMSTHGRINDIYVWDISTGEWKLNSLVCEEKQKFTTKRSILPVQGSKPEPRSGHKVVIINNKLLVLGGFEKALNEVYQLDLPEKLLPKI